MKNLRLLVSLLMILPLRPNDAPGQRSSPGGGDADSLRGCWTLTRLVDAGGERPLGEVQVRLCFASDRSVTGGTGVNNYHADYVANPDGHLRWLSPIANTRLDGPDPIIRLEGIYLPALASTARWEILPAGGPELRLSTSDGKTVLLFRRQADPPPPTP